MRRDTRERYWQEQLDLFLASGMSRKEFCEKQGYTTQTLRYWNKRLKGPAKAEQAFVRAKTRPTAASPSSMKVLLPNGVAIDYAGTVNESLLKSLAAIGG